MNVDRGSSHGGDAGGTGGHRLPPAAPTAAFGVRPGRDETAAMPASYEMLGPYRLIERVGEGGMGVVHRALDQDGREVAIKVLRSHIAYDTGARERLRREVSTLSRVHSQAVAEVLDADVDGDQPYLVTRFVPGPPLDDVVEDDGPMDPSHLVELGRGLADALRAIHDAGVVHRDVKPGNVLMEGEHPVLIDFGIAHVADDVRLTATGLVMGTPGYLSPEIVEGAPVSQATDWWGWAATLEFAASGRPPFGRGPMHVVLDRVTRGQADLSGVDERLRPLLAAALSPHPQERPSADEVLEALEVYAGGGHTGTMRIRPATERLPEGAGGAAAGAAAAGAAGEWLGGEGSGASRPGDPASRSGDPAARTNQASGTEGFASGSAGSARLNPPSPTPARPSQSAPQNPQPATRGEWSSTPGDGSGWRASKSATPGESAGWQASQSGAPGTAAYPQGSADPTSVQPRRSPDPTQQVGGRDPYAAPQAVSPGYTAPPQRSGYGGPAAYGTEDGQGYAAAPRHDPRIAQPARTWTLAALLAAVVGVCALWPLVGLALLVLWSFAARWTDKAMTSMVMRRFSAGPRRSDTAVAVASSPWHALTAFFSTVLSALVPAFVGVCTAVIVALGFAMAGDGNPHLGRPLPIAAGVLVACWTLWWGPGGASMRRGSRSMVRGAVRGEQLTRVIIALLAVIAAGATIWSLLHLDIQVSAWPLTPDQIPFGDYIPSLPGSG